MKKIFFLLFVQLSANIFAQDAGIKFTESQTLAQLLQKAGTEKKLLFIDCYATWCGPCKYLSGKIFTQKEVGDFYNSHFINAKFDMEKGEGIEIARKYKVKAYPTLLFLDSNGEVVHTMVGAGDANDIINLGKTAINPNSNYRALLNKLNKGDYSAETITGYLQINPYAENKNELLDKFYTTLKEEEKVSIKTWEVINKYVDSHNNQLFKFLLANEEKFKKVVSVKDIDNHIFKTFFNSIRNNYENKESSQKLETELKALNHPAVAKAYTFINLNILYSKISGGEIVKADWDSFISSADEIIKYMDDWNISNQLAWFVFENYKKANDTNALKKAQEWALKSIQIERNAYNLDTYANIVFDLGNAVEAIKYGEEALDIARKNNDAKLIESINERLNYFKNNQKK